MMAVQDATTALPGRVEGRCVLCGRPLYANPLGVVLAVVEAHLYWAHGDLS